MSLFKTYSVKFIVLLLAMQILNLSVYGNEYYQTIVLKNKQVKYEMNQIDSMVEYVVEVAFRHYDAFPELQGNHTKNEQKTIKTPFQLYTCREQQKEEDKIEIPVERNKYGSYRETYHYLYFKEINPPPPKTDFFFM